MTVAKVISTPPRWLKVAAFTARASLSLLATAWIVLLTVWSALHFIIVPRIAEFRPLLQEQASRMLGVSVQIGNIVATSNGVIPSFELSQVRLFDAQGHEVLTLPRILVALSARSLLVLGLEQLTIDGPVLNVRRASDGQIWVAGFALPKDEKGNSAGADWVFSQPELAIRNGTVNWSDELRAAPVLTLTDVDWVLRNQQRGHAMRLQASPPPAWGGRLSVSGIFKQRLLSLHAGAWHEWDGVVFADLPQTDLSHVRNYADLGVDVVQGVGALRVWADVHQGAFTGATADVALHRVQVMVKPELEALGLSQVSGRLGVKVLAQGLEFSTQALQFDTEDGLHWPGGNVRVALFTGDAKDARKSASGSGELVADRLDLAALARIASRLPLDEAVRTHLQELAPKGLIERLEGNWQGSGGELSGFAAKGRVVGLELAAQTAEQGVRPGFGGADIDFDFTRQGGRARVAVRQGRVDAPGLFEDPLIELEQLSGDVQWKMDGPHTSLAISDLHFGNADLQGVAQIKWQTDAATPLPGLLDLQANLSRAQANRVFRYLPLPISKEVRDYVRDAISTGTASQVRFKVKGPLQDFPYTVPQSGEFRITANLQDVDYAYVPTTNPRPDGNNPPWPALSGLDAELIIDHTSLQVRGARSRVAGFAGLQLNKIDSVIHDLYDNAFVSVNAGAQGPLADMLDLVNRSPLATLTGKALANATATGQADYRFKLGIPLDAVERSSVQGAVVLAGNDLQLSSTIPRLARVRGTVSFSENGFSVANGQAKVLGGEMRMDGGWSNAGTSKPPVGTLCPKPSTGTLCFQGVATVDGLRQARELGFVSRLAQYASGSASYSAVLGSHAGVPELLITSNLTGLALNLPAPFAKTAEATMPLRLETTVVRSPSSPSSLSSPPLQEQLQLELGQPGQPGQPGRLASVVYVRDISGAEPRVVRGAITLGLAADESVSMPAEGVAANVNAASLDLDAWSDVASRLASSSESPAASASSALSAVGMGYLPNRLALRVGELTIGGRKLNRVLIGSGRDGLLWRANLDASELNGYVEYRQPTGSAAGGLYARLSRLAIAQSAAQDVENLLDEQPSSIPALDVVVEDFELRGKKLGRMEVIAENRSTAPGGGEREWRLNRFFIKTPEAELLASGNWANVSASTTSTATAMGRSIRERRRTLMNFRLDINDAGELLNRFGMREVLRKGRGKIEGQVAWMGSPITLDYASMGGNFNVLVEYGQFLKAEPGIAKLLGVLSLQALPRRLTLDFRDVFSQGFSFDFIRGDVAIEQGIAKTNNLQMKGVNAAVLMEGQADIARETQNIKVVVVPEINAGSASLIASAINPMVGLSTFLAQLILRKPLIEAATQEFVVDGSWVDPLVTKVKRNFAKPEGIQ